MNLLGGKSSKNIVIRFVADITKASRSIDQLQKKMEQVGSGKRAGVVSGPLGNFTPSFLNQFVKGFGDMGEAGAAAMAKIAGGALIAYGAFKLFKGAMNETFKYGTMVETALTSMELFAGSAKRANQIMKEARVYSVKTPFTPTEVFSATTSALQFGLDPFGKGKYGLSKDTSLMDIIGGLGSYQDIHGKKLGMNRSIYAIQRGDLRLLRPYGKDVIAAHENALTQGKAGTTPYIEKFIENLGKLPQVMAMAERQSMTVMGLWSTISGIWQEMWIAMSGSDAEKGVVTMWTQVKDILLDIRNLGLEWIEKTEYFFRDLGTLIGGIFTTLYGAIKVVFTLLWPFLRLLGNFIHTFIIKPFQMFFSLAGKVLMGLSKIMNLFFHVTGIKGMFDAMVRAMENFANMLGGLFVLLDTMVDQMFAKLDKMLNHPVFKRIMSLFKRIMSPYGDASSEGKGGYQRKAAEDYFTSTAKAVLLKNGYKGPTDPTKMTNAQLFEANKLADDLSKSNKKIENWRKKEESDKAKEEAEIKQKGRLKLLDNTMNNNIYNFYGTDKPDYVKEYRNYSGELA